MASVRKRSWGKGSSKKVAWVVDYTDVTGKRRSHQEPSKAAAEAYRSSVDTEVRKGTHVAPAASVAVGQACDDWIKQCRRKKLDPLTIEDYQRHVDKQIVPRLGTRRVSALGRSEIERFLDAVIDDAGRDMAGRVLKSLKAALDEAVRIGKAGGNVADKVKLPKRTREVRRAVIPGMADITAVLAAAERWREPWLYPLLLLAVFCALRSSELRGLGWGHVDLDRGLVRIERRADRLGRLGEPKSAAGWRTIPMPPAAVEALKLWRPNCPTGPHDLVFPTSTGTVMLYGNLMKRQVIPLQVSIGMVRPWMVGGVRKLIDGVAASTGRHGMHAFRHFGASLWIHNRINLKRLQKYMGHADIGLTMRIYGHLIEELEDDAAIALAAQEQVFGRKKVAAGVEGGDDEDDDDDDEGED